MLRALGVHQNLDFPTSGADLVLVKPSPEKGVYTVKAGDTQWTVSQKLGVDLGQLAQLNPEFAWRYPGIARVLRPGEKVALLLPSGNKSLHESWTPSSTSCAYTPRGGAVQPDVNHNVNKTESNVISLQRQLGWWPAQLDFSRHVVQYMVPNILNGGIPTVMGGTFLPELAVKALPELLVAAAVLNNRPLEQGNWGATRLLIEGMFAHEAQTAITLRAFTPIVTRSDGDDGRRPQIGTYVKTQKHHLFQRGLGLVSIELGRVSLSKNAQSRLRTATITTTAALPVEHRFASAGKTADSQVRSLSAVITGEETTYRITTEESRLKNILTGKLALPDPFTLHNMKVGDQVTVDTGFMMGVESEWRFILPVGSKRVLGVGLDGKIDKTHAVGNRLVITAASADPVSLEINSVVVTAGKSITDLGKLGAGVVLTPNMAASKESNFLSKTGNAGASVGLKAASVRAMTQLVHNTNDNHFNFVEIDLTQPKGKALYEQILKTGDIPPLPKSKCEDHIKAHGKIDFELDKTSTVLQLVEYGEKAHTVGCSSQLSASQNFEISSRVEVHRKVTLDYANDESFMRGSKVLQSNAEGGDVYLPQFGFAQGEIETKSMSFNDQTVSVDQTTDRQHPDEHAYFNFKAMTYSVPASQAVDVFEGFAAQTARGGVPAYLSLSLTTKDASNPTLGGQEAINHLNHLKNPDAEWYTGFFIPPSVNMVWELDKDANVAAFFSRLTADAKCYADAEFKRHTATFVDSIGFQFKMESDLQLHILSILGLAQTPADNFMKLNALGTPSDMLSTLKKLASTNPSSFIDLLADFHDAGVKAGRSKAPYPIHVTYATMY